MSRIGSRLGHQRRASTLEVLRLRIRVLGDVADALVDDSARYVGCVDRGVMRTRPQSSEEIGSWKRVGGSRGRVLA
jgi:hypothetical protein